MSEGGAGGRIGGGAAAVGAAPARGATERAAEWVYRGVWGLLVQWLRVPPDPPTLPVGPGEVVRSFRPAPGFLRYLKFWFWLLFWPMDVAILAGWIAVLAVSRPWAIVLAGPALFLAIAPDILAYIAIHVRYDTTWYVMTDRSIRIRRGVWRIHEATITFENVQNVTVRQGPVERVFGIASVVIETAGAAATPGHGGMGNQAMVEGVDNAAEIRDLVVQRMRKSKSAGLGDEREGERESARGPGERGGWTRKHVEALREIREEVGRMRG